MADNFFDYLYGADSAKKPVQGENIAQDESIVPPWTHKFTIYCSNPSKSFLEELKTRDGVVAVYVKEKDKTADNK